MVEKFSPDKRRIKLIGEDIDESQGTTEDEIVTNFIPDGPNSNPNIPTGFRPGGSVVSTPTGRTIQKVGENTGTVVFDVQPNVTESGGVSYFEIGDIRQAANMLIYMGTPSREFSITGRFVSRSLAEATINWIYVQRLRSWRMPEQKGGGLNALKTPSRLKLRGLGNWFNDIHVRITNLSIEEPEDVDYITTGNGKDVPIVWPVSISLKEARSVEEMRAFNIETFRQGTLGGW